MAFLVQPIWFDVERNHWMKVITLFTSITMLCETSIIMRNIPPFMLMSGLFYRILSVMLNIVPNLNNVMVLARVQVTERDVCYMWWNLKIFIHCHLSSVCPITLKLVSGEHPFSFHVKYTSWLQFLRPNNEISLPNASRLQGQKCLKPLSLVCLEVVVFSIEVFNTYQMSFWPSKIFYYFIIF